MASTVLIVDDDPIQQRLLSAAIERLGHRTLTAADGAAAMTVMASTEGQSLALVILDLVMPELDGMAVLERMRAQGITTPVIVQTAQGGIDTVVNAMRAGAIDFVVKPASPERLQVSVENALKLKALEGTVARMTGVQQGKLTFRDIITRSDAMERVIRLGKRAAASHIPILVEGESGVGKELIARAIQGTSGRRSKPFITVNCAAIPDNLVESILFGHEKGAFTGASEKHTGKFRQAHGGTLFLDEVGELSPDIQVKLLRALQEGEIDPVGAKHPTRVDFRLISATNKSLLEQTRAGKFRDDLYYRLNVFPIRVPPLRERREDIPELVRYFTARIAAEEGKSAIRGVTAKAMRLLTGFDWPGNIRQLENAVFRAVVLADGVTLTPAEFPQITAHGEQPDRPPAIAGEMPVDETEIEPINLDFGLGDGAHDDTRLPTLTASGEIRKLADIEAEMIRRAITHYGGRMTKVARALGIGRSTLYRKLKDLGISDTLDGIAAE
ncbi:MAG: sigma-54-dependent transcriptional regulator [Alphaproteobacteria bacterium]